MTQIDKTDEAVKYVKQIEDAWVEDIVARAMRAGCAPAEIEVTYDRDGSVRVRVHGRTVRHWKLRRSHGLTMSDFSSSFVEKKTDNDADGLDAGEPHLIDEDGT